MEQHPVPQNITSYEFRLVGDMTLKQFFQLAGGIVVGIFFYRLPIVALVKYPLVFISVVSGILMAFVPLQGRPFTQWIVAFIRAIYSPTEFVWVPPLGSAQPQMKPASDSSQTTTNSQQPQTTPQSPPSKKPVSLNLLSALKTAFSGLFTKKIKNVADSLPSSPVPPTTLSKAVAEVVAPIAPPPPESISLKSPDIPTPPAPPKPASVVVKPGSTQTSTGQFIPPPVETPNQTSPSFVKPIPTSDSSPVPLQGKPTVFEATPAPISLPKSDTALPVKNTPPTPVFTANPTAPASSAIVSTDISTPTVPNILSGLVLDQSDKMLSGATIEIVDSATGIPVRALRSNRLGQFQIAIPLPVGSYIVNLEKEGFNFDPVSVQVKNSIIQPIVLKARPA